MRNNPTFVKVRNLEHAAVAAPMDIMQALSERELRGVMAPELAHMKHRDTLISTISATMAGAFTSIVQFGMIFGGGRGTNSERNAIPIVSMLKMFFAYIAAALIQMAISHSREFDANRGSAEIYKVPSLWQRRSLKLIRAHTKSPTKLLRCTQKRGR